MSSSKPISENDFHLLASFLMDANKTTSSLARAQLREALRVHPAFGERLAAIADPLVRREAELIHESLWFERLEPEFEALFAQGPKLDLETGAYLLATIAYPELTRQQITDTLDTIATQVDRMISDEPALPTRAVRAMQRYLFELSGFKGNVDNYNDPDNSFINRVLQRHLGIPISLSCVYLFIGWRLNMPVYGVGLPGHFIVGHRISKGVIHIDPFNAGRILRRKDCEVLVRKLGYQFKEEYLDAAPNDQILSRMMVNLINTYTEQGQIARAHWLTQLMP